MALSKRSIQFISIVSKLGAIAIISTGINVGLLSYFIPPIDDDITLIKVGQRHLQSAMTEIESENTRLDTQISALSITADDLSHRLTALKETQQEIINRLSALDEENKSSSELALFYKNKIAELASKIERLSLRAPHISRLSEKQTVPTPSSHRGITSSQPHIIPKKIPPPFTLHSVQMRGATYVAVVSPLNTDSLANVALIKTNDQYQGWRIVSVRSTFIDIQKAQKITRILTPL